MKARTGAKPVDQGPRNKGKERLDVDLSPSRKLGMSARKLAAKPSADLAHGQIVIVTARWIMVLAAVIFTFWIPGSLGELRILTAAIIALAVGNFYLHAQLLMRRPAIDLVVYASSAVDIAVVSLIIAVQGGFSSDVYIFYFPALLALSVAFPTAMTAAYTIAAVGLYGLVTAGTSPLTDGNAQILVTRLIMMAAVAVCGNLYWRIEGQRRKAAVAARESLAAQLRRRPPAAPVEA